MPQGTSTRWARTGKLTVVEPPPSSSSVQLQKPTENIRRTASFQDREKTAQKPKHVRPKLSDGMLQLLAFGHVDKDELPRYRPRPSSAMAMRKEPEESKSFKVPEWSTSGPPIGGKMEFLGGKMDTKSLGTSPMGTSSPHQLITTPLSVHSRGRKILSAQDIMDEIEGNERQLLEEKERQLVDFLQSIPHLAHIHRDKLVPLAGNLTSSHERFGTVLQKENEKTDHIIILWNGTVKVERTVINATASKDIPILSSCLRKPLQSRGAQVEAAAVQEGSAVEHPKRSVVTGTCCRGSVFGEFSSIFNAPANETVRVESVGGAHVLRILAANVLECCDEKALALLKAKVKQIGMWREDQANNLSGSMTTASYQYAPKHEVLVTYATPTEMSAVIKASKQDILRPLGWRQKMQREAERAAAEAHSEAVQIIRQEKKSTRKSLLRPASAFVDSTRKRESRHDQKDHLQGVDNISARNLFLATWTLPESHRVHIGKGVRGDSSAANGWHLEIDIDALTVLDDKYLPSCL